MASEISGISSLKLDRRAEFHASLGRRDYIINLIGIDNFDLFEDWAFQARGHVYDRSIYSRWANNHSTKGISEDPDVAVVDMVKIWIAVNNRKSRESYLFLSSIYPSILGPGLDSDEDIDG